MQKLDPTKMKDWEIAHASEKNLRAVSDVINELGLQDDEWVQYGSALAKIDAQKVLTRVGANGKKAKYIDVTAITPTPLGEGKTTTSVGLVEGLGLLGKKVIGCLRQPSGGPTFNIKGSAAGGGLAQVIPLTSLSLGLTGDNDAVTNANNLAMVALNARMQHERNHDDEWLAARGLKRLDIDPERIQLKWAIDFCAQGLRDIEIGRGGALDGFKMSSGFYITVASEVMAILSMASDLADLRKRLSKMVVAYSKSGKSVTTRDLEVDGAMCAILVNALKPTLMQTIEGQPVFVHAGPFANIAIGQNSVIADRLACALGDYVVTESGFASDMGFEKFWNIKCACSGLKPDAIVLVATVRALKAHGGAPQVKAGMPLDEVYTSENLELLEKGCENLKAHIDIILRSGVKPIVCLNAFYTDTKAERELVRKVAEEAGVRFAVSDHWLMGGEGALELAKEVIAQCDEPNDFKPLCEEGTTISHRIESIVKEVYGGDGVDFTPEAAAKLELLEKDEEASKYHVCVAKTQYSLSHDPKLLGRPKNWRLPVRDILVYGGAGLVVPVTGEIKLLPGTSASPAFRRIDVDVQTGQIKGLF